MDTLSAPTKYKNHRFPVEIISHAVLLYFWFCLSFREVEELLCERGITVTYEGFVATFFLLGISLCFSPDREGEETRHEELQGKPMRAGDHPVGRMVVCRLADFLSATEGDDERARGGCRSLHAQSVGDQIRPRV